ncbi:alkaline phosphatase family protein [Mucilaginibacter myungsuensis]|uniref:Alkaline phosphatase family protein n=1 Tax=Mucilaginibacter myungsuensis TaxID=649104 RepID=A0A929KZY9_9SPHI|nr:nucleotide pyrophosphatase/phosphodiesterase family protein [Mucilaginibacter myungsuensis]MBE9660766.1 alkaline phosphatase family protein [Mucilaginibacter myungsuensis]MDN3600811.1 alkaline phosphatase family protein [Mucilaginibacter myungsuensis]
MNRTVVIDIVGLSTSVIGEHTPFLSAYIAKNNLNVIEPVLPAVTTSVQSTYVTGKWPSENGIVGNGWYDRADSEIKFWKQSNKLVQGDKIWDKAKALDPSFTTSKMFWWYNMYSTADYSVTPRPQYLADGRKQPDCYSQPPELRDELQNKLGQFPLFQFWGPGANIKSTRWIADAAMHTDDQHNPTLTLIYLPHLDYCLQKFGPDLTKIAPELKEIDEVVKDLVTFYERKGAKIILLSEYGIAPVNNPIHLNRLLRQNDMLGIRVENGLELLDPGASKAFAVADHQIAHIYINDPSVTEKLKSLIKGVKGVELVLDRTDQKKYNIDHERAGDLVIMADKDSWFTYYFWLDDAVAPDYARMVDIHKKPGYDPVEMFMTSKGRAAYKLLRKKLGFRYVMDVIPLDATLIKGSHGRVNIEDKYKAMLVTSEKIDHKTVTAVDVYDVMWKALTEK